MKLMTVVGARPQFVKAAAIDRQLTINPSFKSINNILVHTGQHFDSGMSKVFFDELNISKPKYNLDVSGGGHGSMTGRMLSALEPIVELEAPDCLLTYGDTNSTLSAALVAAKLGIPVAHVEAGLRSYNRAMPEEINRVLVDHLSTHLFCPTEQAVENARIEGLVSGVSNVGDVMYDVVLNIKSSGTSSGADSVMQRSDKYVLATIHRAENTDNPEMLREILIGLARVSQVYKVIFPLHPRTKAAIIKNNFESLVRTLELVPPVGFIDMVKLETGAKVIVTDSGGVQKEAFFASVPCVTARNETEWVETVASGWNKLVGANAEKIFNAVMSSSPPAEKPTFYGRGDAACLILNELKSCY